MVLVVLVEIEHITTGGLASAQVLPCLAGLLLEVPPTQMRRFLSLRRQSPEAPEQVTLDHRGPAGWLSIPAHLPAMPSLAASSPATFSSIPPCPQKIPSSLPPALPPRVQPLRARHPPQAMAPLAVMAWQSLGPPPSQESGATYVGSTKRPDGASCVTCMRCGSRLPSCRTADNRSTGSQAATILRLAPLVEN